MAPLSIALVLHVVTQPAPAVEPRPLEPPVEEPAPTAATVDASPGATGATVDEPDSDGPPWPLIIAGAIVGGVVVVGTGAFVVWAAITGVNAASEAVSNACGTFMGGLCDAACLNPLNATLDGCFAAGNSCSSSGDACTSTTSSCGDSCGDTSSSCGSAGDSCGSTSCASPSAAYAGAFATAYGARQPATPRGIPSSAPSAMRY